MLPFYSMRVCVACKKEKPFSDFGERRSGEYQSRCKECARVYGRMHYRKNKELYVARNKRQFQRRRDWYNDLKNNPCMDCGGRFPPCVMDFDHREGVDKKYNVSTLMTRKIASKQRVLDEIAKCDLVCANCHRLRTWKRRQTPS